MLSMLRVIDRSYSTRHSPYVIPVLPVYVYFYLSSLFSPVDVAHEELPLFVVVVCDHGTCISQEESMSTEFGCTGWLSDYKDRFHVTPDTHTHTNTHTHTHTLPARWGGRRSGVAGYHSINILIS